MIIIVNYLSILYYPNSELDLMASIGDHLVAPNRWLGHKITSLSLDKVEPFPRKVHLIMVRIVACAAFFMTLALVPFGLALKVPFHAFHRSPSLNGKLSNHVSSVNLQREHFQNQTNRERDQENLRDEEQKRPLPNRPILEQERQSSNRLIQDKEEEKNLSVIKNVMNEKTRLLDEAHAYFQQPRIQGKPFKIFDLPPYGYKGVLQAARRAGTRVVAIDTTIANYSGLTQEGKEKRWKAMNYFAYRTMKQTIKQLGNDKFVALVGAGHLNKRGGYIPGLKDLLPHPNMIIEDGQEGASLNPILKNGVPWTWDPEAHADLVLYRKRAVA